MEGRRGGGNGDEAADKEGSAGHQCLLTHGLGGGHRTAREMGLRDVLPASALAPWPTPPSFDSLQACPAQHPKQTRASLPCGVRDAHSLSYPILAPGEARHLTSSLRQSFVVDRGFDIFGC